MQPSSWFARIRMTCYPANGGMDEHRHAVASLCLLAGGRYEERIRGRSQWHLPGEMMFCPADEPHAQSFASEGALKILFDVRADTLDYLRGHVSLSDAPSMGSPGLQAIAHRMRAELSGGCVEDTTRLMLEGLALEALVEFSRSAGTSIRTESWLGRAREYVHAHACTRFSLEDMARALDHHPAHVARSFRSAFGSSVGEMVRELRLAKAMQLLRETRSPIAEIAVECGFTDQAHLTRRFRARHGTTPARFRRNR